MTNSNVRNENETKEYLPIISSGWPITLSANSISGETFDWSGISKTILLSKKSNMESGHMSNTFRESIRSKSFPYIILTAYKTAPELVANFTPDKKEKFYLKNSLPVLHELKIICIMKHTDDLRETWYFIITDQFVAIHHVDWTPLVIFAWVTTPF